MTRFTSSAGLAASLALLTAMSGCGSLEDDQPRVLIYVTGMEFYTTATATVPAEVLDAWWYGYYLPETKSVHIDNLDTQGKATWVENSAAMDIRNVSAEITLPFNINSPATLQAALDVIKPLLPPGEAGMRYSYALTMMGPTPMWTVTVQTPGAAPLRIYVDATTNAISNVTHLPATGAITPNPTNDDFSHEVALPYGELLASGWASDAFLYRSAAMESDGTMFARMPWRSEEDGGSFLVPPDIDHADGKSAAWGFLFYSPVRHQLIPVVVYASVLGVIGDERTPRYPANHYVANEVTGTYVSPEDVVTHYGSWYDASISYLLRNQYSAGLSWSLVHEIPAGFESIIRELQVDARTNAIIRCAPEGICQELKT